MVNKAGRGHLQPKHENSTSTYTTNITWPSVVCFLTFFNIYFLASGNSFFKVCHKYVEYNQFSLNESFQINLLSFLASLTSSKAINFQFRASGSVVQVIFPPKFFSLLVLLKPPHNGVSLPVRRMMFNNSNNFTLQSLKQLRCFHDNFSRIASRYSTSTIKASLIILGLEMALGFVANTTLFVRLRNFGHHSTIYRILLQNLCLIGALNSLIGMPTLFSTIFLSFIECTQVPAALCRTRYFSLTYSFMTNSTNICFLSLDRYDFICRPFRRRITKDNINRYLAIIWLVPFLVGLLHFVIKIDSTNCILISSVEGPYSEPMLVLLVVVFVLTCSYVLFTSWSSLKSMRNLAGRLNISKQKRVRSEKHMLFLTIKIVATYLVSVAPTILWSFTLRVGGIKNCLFCNDTRIYLQLLLFVMYVANPFIFMRLPFKKKRKLKRKIVGPKDHISRRQNFNQVASVILPPFRVIPSHGHASLTSLGGVHRFSKRGSRRVAPIPREKERNNKERTPNSLESANHEKKTRQCEHITYLS